MDLTRLPIADGAVPVTVFALAALLLLVLAVRRWTRRALLWAGGAALCGAVLGYAAYKVVNLTDVFGDAAPTFVWHWTAAAFAASGFALGGLVGARVGRRAGRGGGGHAVVVGHRVGTTCPGKEM